MKVPDFGRQNDDDEEESTEQDDNDIQEGTARRRYIAFDLIINLSDGSAEEVYCTNFTIGEDRNTLVLIQPQDLELTEKRRGYPVGIAETGKLVDRIHLSRLKSTVLKSVRIVDARVLEKRQDYRYASNVNRIVDSGEMETEEEEILPSEVDQIEQYGGIERQERYDEIVAQLLKEYIEERDG